MSSLRRTLGLLTVIVAVSLFTTKAYAITFVNSTTTPPNGLQSSITISVPTGTADNDGEIACVAWYGDGPTPTIGAPGGWTQLQNMTQAGSCSNFITQMACFSHVAASEPADYTWTFSGGTAAASGGILDYRNILTSGMIDVSGVQGGLTFTATAPSVTTTKTNDFLVSVFGSLDSISTSPIGETQRFLIHSPFEDADLLAADSLQTSIGPTGAKTVSLFSAPCASWVGMSIAIAAGPPIPPAPPSNVAVTGTIENFYGKPCVACHVDLYALSPTLVSNLGSGGTLIETNPVRVETNGAGVFNASVVGSITAALYVEETMAVMKFTLPSSGTITLAQIQAQQPNVVSAFPPTGNLNMGGNRFINLGPGQALGDSASVGQGLGAGGQIVTASGNYSFPTGATFAEVLLVGAGGGGGGGNSGSSNGGGGGSGGTVERCILYPANGAITITLGAAGTGGAVTTNGTNGGDTTAQQGVATCTAPKGLLGTAGSGGGTGTGGAAGSSGSVTGSARQLYTAVGATGGNGTAPGAGGSGAGNGQFGGDGGAASGGAGSDGIVGSAVIFAY